MCRKIFICAVAIAAIVCIGCGADKVVGSPEKAILAYAELLTIGESANMTDAGFTEEDAKKLSQLVVQNFADSFSGVVPLSAESSEQLAKIFHENCKAKLNFQATVKTMEGDPVVELKTTPLDIDAAAKLVGDDLIALVGMVGKLKSEGATEEQLRENPEVQKVAVTALSKYIAAIPLKAETTFDVKCEKVDGSDGQVHWAPANVVSLANFLTSKK